MKSHKASLIPLLILTACLVSSDAFAKAKPKTTKAKAATAKAETAKAKTPPATEEQLLAVLKSSASAGEKCNACRELQLRGTEKSIPVLAGLLSDADISHCARIALETMPYPAVDAVFREAATKTSGLVKAGILDSLGQGRDAEALPLLTAALEDKDTKVVAAAALALGRIGTLEAAKALYAAHDKAQGESRTTIENGFLLAPFRGIVAIALTDELASPDARIRASGMAGLRNISATDLQSLAADMDKFPAASQVAILAAVRLRGDKSLAPIALKAAEQKDAAVRLAAVKALGTVGDASALPLLIGLAKAGGAQPPREATGGRSTEPTTLAVNDPLAAAAWQSLLILTGPKVDEGIFAALRAEQEPARRVQWIEVVESRRGPGLAQVLLGETTHVSQEVRAAAMTALAKVAGPKNLPAMLAAMLKVEKGPLRDQTEKAVMLVCQQNADATKRADPVLAVYRSASAADRNELLPLLGRIGGTGAKQEVQAALASKDAAISTAGLRALCNWPDGSVTDQLLGLAQTTTDETHRRWALRALIRVSVLDGKPTSDKLATLRRALALARRDEDRRLVLERAASVRSVEALKFLTPYLSQPALAEQACKSIVELARHKEIHDPHKKEFAPVLRQVLATSHDKTTLEQARRYSGK